MGAWATLPVSAARVRQAHRTARFVVDGPNDTATFKDGIDPTAPEAKSLVETELTGALGKHVARFGSPEAMLDAIASEEKLASGVQAALAYGLLHSEQFSGRNSGRDRYAEDADYFLKQMKGAVRAVAQTAPFVLGLTRRTSGSVGGSMASTMGTYRDGYGA